MKSVFKAIYGRRPGGTTYTKDFHQPRGAMARALERALGISEGGTAKVEWRWPGGADSAGKLLPAADFAESNGRMNLRWQTDSAPKPWRLTPAPTSTTTETMAGIPDLASDSAADAQLMNLIGGSEEPYLLAVKLRGEGNVLHTRLVLGNPKPGREFASVDTLPALVRDAIATLETNRPGGFVEFGGGRVARAVAIVEQILDAFKRSPNVLLVGPPGTGKTVAMEDIVHLWSDPDQMTFDPDTLHGGFSSAPDYSQAETRIRSLVFHPSFAYEDFVMGLLPEPVAGGVSIKPHVGPLLELAAFAAEEDRRALLICDEFNRGQAAAIFGDTLGLLDRDKRSTPGDPDSGASIDTPFHHLNPSTADGKVLGSTIRLPRTLFVLAAMNSADRSVAPLDAALRRRFAIVHVGPDYDVLRDHLGIPEALSPGIDPTSWTTVGDIKAIAVNLLEAINDRIETILGRDFVLGQSVVWHVDGESVEEALTELAMAMDTNIIGTLALTFTDNDAALAAVLNVDKESGDAPQAGRWIQPDEAIRNVATERLRPALFKSLPQDVLVATLASLL